MNRDIDFEKSIDAYSNITTPAEYDDMVNETIKKAYGNSTRRANTSDRRQRLFAAVGACAAAAAAVFVISVNASTALAASLADVPIIGRIVKVVTGESFSSTDNNVSVNVNVPRLEADTASPTAKTTVTADQVNAQIQTAVDEYIAEQSAVIEQYKQDFFATGGTEEEWNKRTIDLTADYEVKYQDDRYLSLYIYMYMSAFSFTQENYYYNYNFAEGRELTLRDILGDDYINIANSSVIAQIQEQTANDPDKMYWGYNTDTDGLDGFDKFTTITDETEFYINSDGKPVVCFPKYSIAPGYMGVCEFVIE